MNTLLENAIALKSDKATTYTKTETDAIIAGEISPINTSITQLQNDKVDNTTYTLKISEITDELSKIDMKGNATNNVISDMLVDYPSYA